MICGQNNLTHNWMDSLSIPQNTSETLTEEADNIITTIGHSSGAETWMPLAPVPGQAFVLYLLYHADD